MRLHVGRPRAAMVIAPHPDDEVIGAFGLIRHLRRCGTRVTVVVVTDGGASHPSSPRWPRARLVAERRRESRRALRRLGIGAAAIRFLDLPDGGLSTDAMRCRRAIHRTIAHVPDMGLLIGPAAQDAHPDHQAVAAAIDRVRRPARRLAYRVWPPARKGRGDRAFVTGLSASAKRSVVRCHRTQMGAITDDPTGFAIARHELAAFTHPVERYRVVAW